METFGHLHHNCALDNVVQLVITSFHDLLCGYHICLSEKQCPVMGQNLKEPF